MTAQHKHTVTRSTEVRHQDQTFVSVTADYGIQQTSTGVYFSLTGEARTDMCESHDQGSSGAIHEILIAAFPWLKLIETVHLCDALTGEPMHAEANGWYWFVSPLDETLLPPYHYTGLDGAHRAASYLGCDPKLFADITATGHNDTAARSQFNSRVDLLRPGWKSLAASVREIYQLN